jgi:hypothetical protein
MKQRISVEQLQELTEEQQRRLREWWKLQPGDIMFDVKMECLETLVGGSNGKAIIEHIKSESKLRFLPLTNIGQMIELLNEKKKQNEKLEINAPIGLISKWSVWYANGEFPKKYENNELCDALWQAVKEVL